MKKSGQFYLLSAIIIIAVLIGFSTISTYTRRGEDVRVFDLGEELGIEGSNVLDYGTYNAAEVDVDYPEGGLNSLVENFVDDYAEYIGEDKEISFVFGNPSDENVTVVNYEETESTISDGRSHITIKRRKRFKPEEPPKITSEGKTTIVFNDKNYDIELKPGENFFFVISQDVEGEVHVAKSENIAE